MIESWEALGEVLADFENRLSTLENSQSSPREPEAREVSNQPVNITYQIDAKSTPAFKELEDRIRFLEGRMTKYFEGKKNVYTKYS